jgi:hypothetical protein
MSACPACPVAPEDGTGVGPADLTGAILFFACLNREQKSSVMDGHELTFNRAIMMPDKIGRRLCCRMPDVGKNTVELKGVGFKKR